MGLSGKLIEAARERERERERWGQSEEKDRIMNGWMEGTEG